MGDILPTTVINRKTGKKDKKKTAALRKRSEASSKTAKEWAGQGLRDIDRASFVARNPDAPRPWDPTKFDPEGLRVTRHTFKGILKARGQGRPESDVPTSGRRGKPRK